MFASYEELVAFTATTLSHAAEHLAHTHCREPVKQPQLCLACCAARASSAWKAIGVLPS